MPDFKSRLEGRSKLKIGRKEDSDTGDPWPNLEFKGQGTKVTSQNSFSLEARPTAGGATWWISLQISV